MNKDFVTHGQAVSLMELGYDEPIPTYYTHPNNELSYVMDGHNKVSVRSNSQFGLAVSAPTKSQVFDWFRDKYGFFCQPNRLDDSGQPWYYFSIATRRHEVVEGSFSYEDAESACIDKLIELAKTPMSSGYKIQDPVTYAKYFATKNKYFTE